MYKRVLFRDLKNGSLFSFLQVNPRQSICIKCEPVKLEDTEFRTDMYVTAVRLEDGATLCVDGDTVVTYIGSAQIRSVTEESE